VVMLNYNSCDGSFAVSMPMFRAVEADL